MSHRNEVPLTDWVAQRDADVAQRVQAQNQSRLRHLTKNHLAYQDAILGHPVTICWGPAGTGKTVLAAAVAVRLLKAGQIKRVVLTRPIVTCDEELGTLPGGIDEKLEPYLAPLVQALRPHFGDGEYDRLVAGKVIEVCPLATMRGRTLTDAVVIADECQNATYAQLRMLLTRLGDGTRMVVTGDVTQADVDRGGKNPLAEVVERLRGNADIRVVRMTRKDCLRPPLVQWIDERLAGGGG